QGAVRPSRRQSESAADYRAYSDAQSEFRQTANLLVSASFGMSARKSRIDIPSLGLDNEISREHNPKGAGFDGLSFRNSHGRGVMRMGTVTFQVLDGVDRGRVFRNLVPPVTIGREEGNILRL